ncbi:MAG TPA: competence/damage-inducible protein A [Gemmatimonadales bacterium]|nr:competence/damage-inducible protein A [Gemmatimonadales bacterium]
MDVELVTVGTELLLGFTVDTNSAEIGRALADAGVRVVRRTAVSDDPAAIRDAVGSALARTGRVITTGGLGPTADDITKTAIAGLFSTPLRFDAAVWAALEARFARLGRVPTANNRGQAEVPEGAVVLPNRWGTAPGLWLEGAPGLVVMLPGVPVEMRNLLAAHVLPRLADTSAGGVIRSVTVRTTAIAESTLAERLGDIDARLAPLTLAYLPGLGSVDLRVTAWNLPATEADRRLAEATALLVERAGEHAYGTGDTDLAELVLAELRRRRLRVAVAESCTGGLLGGRLTAVPGSSSQFVGGVIAYADEAKQRLLGVPGELLRAEGAVSGPVAREMAIGVAASLGAEVAVSITGIAGPDGGSAEKPVGTVWMGFRLPSGAEAIIRNLVGTREEIRGRAAQFALFELWRRLRILPE